MTMFMGAAVKAVHMTMITAMITTMTMRPGNMCIDLTAAIKCIMLSI